MGECIYYKSWNFHAFCLIFEEIVKKIHIDYEIYLEFFLLLLFIICVNHNEEHHGKWKSSMSLNLAILNPCNKHWTSNCNKSLNFKNFTKIQESKPCKLYNISQAQVQ
jgi:hypothetical protein